MDTLVPTNADAWTLAMFPEADLCKEKKRTQTGNGKSGFKSLKIACPPPATSKAKNSNRDLLQEAVAQEWSKTRDNQKNSSEAHAFSQISIKDIYTRFQSWKCFV